jgi:hypothetical protein
LGSVGSTFFKDLDLRYAYLDFDLGGTNAMDSQKQLKKLFKGLDVYPHHYH